MRCQECGETGEYAWRQCPNCRADYQTTKEPTEKAMTPEEIRETTGDPEKLIAESLIEIAATLAELLQMQKAGKPETEREIPYPVVIAKLPDGKLLALVTMPDGEIHEFRSVSRDSAPGGMMMTKDWRSMEDGGTIGENNISASITAELWKREQS